jgi:hypothetical protein
MMTMIARGQVIPFTDCSRMMHGVVLPLDMTRVEVLEVKTGFEAWPLPHHPEEGVITLGQVTQGHLLKWALDDIEEIPHRSSGNDDDPALANLDPLFNLAGGADIVQDIPPSSEDD